MLHNFRTQTLSSQEAAIIGNGLPQLTFHPIYKESHSCSEHAYDPDWAVGDALGQDCMITSGVNFETDSGFMHFYDNDGSKNEDWFGWNKPVLAPLSGEVIALHQNDVVNAPGSMTPGRATAITVKDEAGNQAVIAHLGEVSVEQGDTIKAGDQIGTVGNNGFSRNPHIHIGAITADGEAAQIRWNLGLAATVRRGRVQEFRDLVD